MFTMHTFLVISVSKCHLNCCVNKTKQKIIRRKMCCVLLMMLMCRIVSCRTSTRNRCCRTLMNSTKFPHQIATRDGKEKEIFKLILTHIYSHTNVQWSQMRLINISFGWFTIYIRTSIMWFVCFSCFTILEEKYSKFETTNGRERETVSYLWNWYHITIWSGIMCVLRL